MIFFFLYKKMRETRNLLIIIFVMFLAAFLGFCATRPEDVGFNASVKQGLSNMLLPQ